MSLAVRAITRVGHCVPTLSLDEPIAELAPWHILNAGGWLSVMVMTLEGERQKEWNTRSGA